MLRCSAVVVCCVVVNCIEGVALLSSLLRSGGGDGLPMVGGGRGGGCFSVMRFVLWEAIWRGVGIALWMVILFVWAMFTLAELVNGVALCGTNTEFFFVCGRYNDIRGEYNDIF